MANLAIATMNPQRLPLIAANWKMHLGLADAAKLAREIREGVGAGDAEAALCVPFTALAVVAEILKGSPVRLGAQNLHWEPQGAFTGEISAAQLADAGCRYVIVGHSERRRLFGETNAIVAKKLAAALAAGLLPILCVGETLEERESQRTWGVLAEQFRAALKDLPPVEAAEITLAYEPVWAIGTGKTASPSQAEEAHAFIRKLASQAHGEGFASALRILYGGSVKADNIDALMAQPDVDGALVGGESLKPISFLRIVHYKTLADAGTRRP